jgi:hypothetical protein
MSLYHKAHCRLHILRVELLVGVRTCIQAAVGMGGVVYVLGLKTSVLPTSILAQPIVPVSAPCVPVRKTGHFPPAKMSDG